ncbi:MAG: xanthomonadin biosynthesis acyl carrier protein XanC [Gammaproteobacteria bacterium]|nr:MAG: xanthomonadin biosynthesis acyl carrier protein XanC [Gammaproteobacteria bacterium]
MSQNTALENEVAALIVEALNLEQEPGSIEPEAALFGEGLGLDSIDALELAVALSQQYGLQLRADDENNKKVFSSLRELSAYVEAHRSK